ncbi:MAG: outer membrane lipoprotein-sorting protein [Terriglobales bacterium]
MRPSHLFRACMPVSFLISILSMAAWAQPPAKADSSPDLERVLDRIDQTAVTFRTTEANFVWDQYQKVVDDKDTQEGKVYFRRAGNETQMEAEIIKVNGKPQAKYVLFTDGKIQLYQPGIEDKVDVYSTGKNKETVESFLVLGFGGSGHGLLKSFDVTYAGQETLEGTPTDKLNLIPKSEKIRNTFDHILLWIDSRGVSIQQQFFTLEGDYRLAKYSDIQLNQKIPDSAFKLKTNGKTQFVSH